MELAQIVSLLEGQGVQCHLTWMEQFLRKELGEECTLEERRGYVTGRWIANCYQRKWGEEEGDNILDQCSPRNPRYTALFTRNMNQVLRGIYGGELEEARGKMEQMRGLVPEFLGEDHGRLKEPLEYLLNCLEWVMNKLEGTGAVGVEASELVNVQMQMEGLAIKKGGRAEEKLRELKRKWEALQVDNRSKAVLMYCKSTVVNPGRRKPVFMDMLREVIKLDPDYFIWRHNAYRALHNRREYGFRRPHDEGVYVPKRYTAPTLEEIEMAKKAYEVAAEPKPEMVLMDYVTVLRKCLKMNVYRILFPNAEVDPCPLENPLQALNIALQLSERYLLEAPDLQAGEGILEPATSKMVARRADLLLLINSTEESREQGLNLLLNTLRDHPEDKFLLFKVAEVYRYGAPDNKNLMDLEKAHHYLVKRLRLGKGRKYFESLRAYVSIFNRLQVDFEMVNEAMEFLTGAVEGADQLLELQGQRAMVRIWRGCLLWCYTPLPGGAEVNRMEACRECVTVLVNIPRKRNSLLGDIYKCAFTKKPSHYEGYHSFIRPHEMKCTLLRLKWEGNLSPEQKQAVSNLMDDVTKSQNGRRGERDASQEYGQGDHESRKWNPDRGNGGSSAADQDDNWRR